MELWIRYLAAVIRGHTGRACADWTREEILDTAATLPRPTVSFEAWKARVEPDPLPEAPAPGDEPVNPPGAVEAFKSAAAELRKGGSDA